MLRFYHTIVTKPLDILSPGRYLVPGLKKLQALLRVTHETPTPADGDASAGVPLLYPFKEVCNHGEEIADLWPQGDYCVLHSETPPLLKKAAARAWYHRV